MAGALDGRGAWALSEGHAGMENQARALAEALGCAVAVKRAPSPPWGWLPARLWPAPLYFANRAGAGLEAPWPDLLISCGRRSVAVALAAARAARAAGGDPFTVHIQRPGIEPTAFDAVVVPRHDNYAGANVIACQGSLHGVTAPRLAAAADGARARFAGLARPLVVVLMGGANRAYGLEAPWFGALAQRLAALARERGLGLAIVPSRRTGAEAGAAVARALEGSGAWLWDGGGDNPYLALLGLADALVVTCDSVNMMSEAAATGKPVYVAMAPGRSPRFERFHAAMRAGGHARPFEDAIDFAWRPVPLHETEAVAAEIAARFAARRHS